MTDEARAESTARAFAAWIKQRQPAWRQLESRLADFEDQRRMAPEVALQAVRSYPEIARDLAIARRASPTSALARQLERAYARLHRGLFRPPLRLKSDVKRLFVHDAPAIAYELRHRILVVATGFALATAGGWWLVASFPELARLFASDTMIETVQGGALWTDGLLNVWPSSVLSARIFTNNIAVTVMAFCLGSIYGLGTIYIIALNGLMIGGVFAFTDRYGLSGRLLEFVVAHGFVELSVIFIAGAIGFSIGEAIARPAHRTRTAAFQRAVSRGAVLMLPCVVFLIGAGLIEGYISPNDGVPMAAKVTIGIGFWLLLLFALGGFRRLGKRGMDARGAALTPGAGASTTGIAARAESPRSPPG